MFTYQTEQLLKDVLDGQLDTAVLAIEKEAARYGYPVVIEKLIDPVLKQAGDLWTSGEISLAQSYVAGKIVEIILDNSMKHAIESGVIVPKRGTIVIGNIEDDFHVLGRRMVCSFLRLDGWTIVDLGNDVAASTFVNAAIEHNAPIIAVSAMMLTTALGIRAVRQELDQRMPGCHIQLAVGGAIFRARPELVAEVGADGTADSAMLAPHLMLRLWQRSVDLLARSPEAAI